MSIVSDIKTVYKKGKDIALNAPEVERKVKDATSNEKWGPTGTQMQEISRASHNFQDLPVIMSVIWKRINDPGKYWRHVYKSLLLIDYLVRNGSDQVIRECRNHMIEIQTLTEFQHIEEDKDVGQSVRERAKQVIELLHDDKRIKTEREKARSNQNKYVGREGGGAGGGGGGYGGDNYRGNGSYDGGGGGGYDRDNRYGDNRYSSDRYGGGDRDQYGDNRYSSDRYGGGDRDRSSYGGDRDRDRDRGFSNDSSRDYGRYGEDESYTEAPAPPRSASPQQPAWDRPAATSSGTRIRAASGGDQTTPPPVVAPAPPVQSLLDIGDFEVRAAPPTTVAQDLNSIIHTPSSLSGFAPPPTTISPGGFTPFHPPSDFDPRNEDFSAFHKSTPSGSFDPFSSQGQQNMFQETPQQVEPQQPKKEDPWEKKELFNLEALNLSEKNTAKGSTPTSSPAKTAMGPAKTPMNKAMNTSTSSLNRPMGGPTSSLSSNTLTPTPSTLTPVTPPQGPTTAFPPTTAPYGYPPQTGYPPVQPPGGVPYYGGGVPPYGAYPGAGVGVGVGVGVGGIGGVGGAYPPPYGGTVPGYQIPAKRF